MGGGGLRGVAWGDLGRFLIMDLPLSGWGYGPAPFPDLLCKGVQRQWHGDGRGIPKEMESMGLEEVAEAVGCGYCRLQMPLKLALGVRGTVAGHKLGALKGGGG